MSNDNTPVTGATFSPCYRYRYALWRTWDASKLPVLFLLLNPSTADEVTNDPTVERCERRARAMGFGGLKVANIFALRSTDPVALYRAVSRAEDPVGPDNDAAIIEAVTQSGLVVCGWGKHGHLNGRGAYVRELITVVGHKPHYLDLNLDGTPKHPLYVPYSLTPQPWSGA